MVAPLVRIVVPGVPRAWQRAGHRIMTNRTGKQFVASYTQAQTRSEQGAAKYFAQAAMQGAPPLGGPLDARVCAYLPVPRSWSKRKQAMALAGQHFPTGKPDADNFLKNLDALTGIVFRDDAQIVDASVWKRYSTEPRLVIEIRPKA